MAYEERLGPVRSSGFNYIKRQDFTIVKEYQRVGKSVISTVKKGYKASWFSDLRDRYHLSIEGIRKGYVPFLFKNGILNG